MGFTIRRNVTFKVTETIGNRVLGPNLLTLNLRLEACVRSVFSLGPQILFKIMNVVVAFLRLLIFMSIDLVSLVGSLKNKR